jgi:excisionase family DNA binding protein
MPDENEAITIEEARQSLGVGRTWIYTLIKKGRIRMIESGMGKNPCTLLSRADVERQRQYRKKRLEELEKRMGGE